MPEIARFYGIQIRIYLAGKEHNPPHIHVKYGSHVAEVFIEDGTILEGELPTTAKTMVREWVMLHKKELNEIWNSQIFRKIPPLE